MKKKIFKYFACMITVAILATTLLLSWVNYEMFKGASWTIWRRMGGCSPLR